MTHAKEYMNEKGNRTIQARESLPPILLPGILLAMMTIVLYWSVQSFDFVYDDHLYVLSNKQVQNGLTLDGIRWSFTSFYAGNWHPLTWISHMADVELYGLQAGGHHWTSVLIHAASVLLLFFILSCLTHSLWASGFAAALFAVHPLHVESVAWVSERKDVLCGFFWILTIGTYTHYVKSPTLRRYLLVLGSFILGLLSKAMIVTLPFVLLLLDYWPLHRYASPETAFDRLLLPGKRSGRLAALRLIVEKSPMLVLVAALAVATVLAQQQIGALWSLEKMPLDARIANAVVSYAEYIGKTIFPVNLSILYPHAGMPPAWKIAASLLLLSSITWFAFRKAREFPFLIVGWMWYLGTLVPVIGLVQVGPQSMADRYVYLPLIGIFIVIAWGMESLLATRISFRKGFLISSSVILLIYCFVAHSQIGIWRNSVTLFEHALFVEAVNPIARYNIGAHYLEKGDCKEAVPHFLAAIEMKKDFAYAFYGLGVCSARTNDAEEALQYFTKAITIDPQSTRPRIDRGFLLMQRGHNDEAMADFSAVLRMDPVNESAHGTMGIMFIQQGRATDAEVHLSEVIRVNPRSAEAHNNMGIVRSMQGRTDDAVVCFEKATVLEPGNAVMKTNLRLAREKQKKHPSDNKDI
jgi:tetratricopeptide (TPR) repeat protein